MKLRILSAVAALFATAIAFAQPNSKLRPDETVLLYADSFEGNVDPVFGKTISYAGFEMEKANAFSASESG